MRIDVPPLVAQREVGFVRIGIAPMMILMHDVLVKALSDARLGQFVREAGHTGLVLDLSTGDLGDIEQRTAEWIATQWAPLLPSVGVQRLAVVLADRQAPLASVFFRAVGVQGRAFPSSDRDALVAFVATPTAVASAAPQTPFAPRGSEELTLPPRAWYYAGGWSAFVGAALGVAWNMDIIRVASNEKAEAFQLAGGVLLGPILAVVSVFVVHLLRASPRGRISWDENGITEWAGEKAVTFISWSTAHFSFLESVLVMRGGRRTGHTFQIHDGMGKTITICDGFRRPDWLNNRPCQIAYMPRYRSMVQRPMQPMVIVPDKLGFGRLALFFFGIVALASYAAFAVGSLAIRTGDKEIGVLLLAAGCVLFAVRMIWPATRLGTRLTRSALVELALRVVMLLAFGGIALAIYGSG